MYPFIITLPCTNNTLRFWIHNFKIGLIKLDYTHVSYLTLISDPWSNQSSLEIDMVITNNAEQVKKDRDASIYPTSTIISKQAK